MLIKSELDKNNLYNIILSIKSNNSNNENISNKCNDFLQMYYNYNDCSEIDMCE